MSVMRGPLFIAAIVVASLVVPVAAAPLAAVAATGVYVPQGFVFAGRAGSLSIYKWGGGGCVYYVTLDPSAFDYVYAGRFLVKRIHSRMEFLLYSGDPFYALLVGGGHVNTSILPLLGYMYRGLGKPGDPVDRMLDDLLGEGVADYFIGRPALRSGGRFVGNLNVTVLDIRVEGPIPEDFLQALGRLREAAERVANTSIDCVLIEEALGRELWAARTRVAGLINLSGMEAMGVAGVGGSRLIPLLVVFDSEKMRRLGVSEAEALQWLDSTIPKNYSPVVVFFADPPALTKYKPIPLTPGNNRHWSLRYLWMLASTVFAVVITIKVFGRRLELS